MTSILSFRGFLAAFALVTFVGCDDKDGGEGEEEVGGEGDSETPVANAGPDQAITGDDTAELDGAASYDPTGQTIKYHWTFDRVPDGSTLTDASLPSNHTEAAQTQLHPDKVGTYVLQLIVEDTDGNKSAADLVVITVTPGENPIANAGPDQEGLVGKPVSVDGSASYDPLGRPLTYEWTLESAPASSSVAALGDSTSVMAHLTPDIGGRYVVSLVVSNGLTASKPDIANIDVLSKDPQPPVADAGADNPGAYDCTAVNLDGSGSFDPNEDPLTYEWSLQSKPASSVASNSSIADRTAKVTTFSPDVAGAYTLSLAVFDGTSWSAPSLVTITAAERPYNNIPTVEAGDSQSLDGGDAACEEDGYGYACDACSAMTVTLGDGASITDSDGDATTLLWTLVSTSGSATIADPTKLNTTAILSGAEAPEPGQCQETIFTFALTATDCPGESGSDTVNVVINCCGQKIKEKKDTGKKP